ncbi:cohesin domain-containing protein [Paucibacter sp. APW11]|uniref:Cohesin domain-containing protein n=1 Tax=Roseateles aquae TaxID=3077235 RepID=A0ABU3P8X6_9BURK|nr:cohesin domain-containing protein [Paucibacter sp. APW11]MDT8999024.1 cohesin domain-containing protein [Paucibacter sp. APW11]
MNAFPQLLGALLLGASLGAPAATLTLIPTSTELKPGSALLIDLMVADLNGKDSVGVFDLQIGYDATLFSFSGYQLGLGLGDAALGQALDISQGGQGTGRVHLGELSLLDTLPVQGQAFKLASLSFTAKQAGVAGFALSQAQLGDAFGTALPVTQLNGVDVTVSAVPEPSSYALLLAGLGLVGLWSGTRRRRD